MPALVGVIVSFLARLFSVQALKWIAMKGLILAVCTLVLPAVLYNIFGRVIGEMIEYGQSAAAAGLGDVSSGGATMLELTGFAGWIAQQIALPSCLAVFLSALTLRYGLHLIRG
jgi:hypothetical protein